MRKKIQYPLFLVLFVAISLTSYAHKDPTNNNQDSLYKTTVSINFSEPILKILSKNTGFDSSLNLKAPFLYIGKQRSKMLYRIGTRISMKNKTNESDLFTDKKYERYNKYDLSLSGLRTKSISSRIKLGYGLAISSFILFDKKIFDSGFDKVTFNNRTWSVAGGPNFLLQYQINKRLSIFTEYVLAYQFSSSYSGKEFSAFPEENYTNDVSRQHGLQIDYPISLYITYHF